jgi:hypothetical protein
VFCHASYNTCCSALTLSPPALLLCPAAFCCFLLQYGCLPVGSRQMTHCWTAMLPTPAVSMTDCISSMSVA